ncbi:hypothetical protein FRC06_007887, partial [Ceratobasidium sp. 370]
DAKATLIAAGYMKTAEERELIILQAWERANVYLKQSRPHRNITRRQVRYVQNLFPPCRKLMKTRLEGLVSSEFHLRDGTDDEIHDLVERQLLPHGFHSQHRGGELGPLHFENRFLAEAIAIMIFRDSTDFGLVFNAIFNPIPPRLLAFACAMIADIIGEHTSGAHITKPTRVETLRPLFNTHLGSLGNLRQANFSCLQNLLMRLHDDCIAHSGVFKDPVAEEPNHVIPARQFDPTPVEPYQPRYQAEQLAALATRTHIVDDKDLNTAEDEEPSVDEEMQSDDGEAGPGPSTLRNRRAHALGADQAEQEYYSDMETYGAMSGVADGTDADFCRFVSNRTGALVLDCDYSKAPERPFPAAPEDVKDIIDHIVKNQEGYFDTSRLAIGGFSAGANLALTSCASQPPGTLKAIVAFYPPADLSQGTKRPQPKDAINPLPPFIIQFFDDAYMPPGTNMLDPRLSPINTPISCFPEHVFIATCGHDPLQYEGIALADRLEQGGVKVVRRHIPGVPHAWDKEAQGGTPGGEAKHDSYVAAVEMLNVVFKNE